MHSRECPACKFFDGNRVRRAVQAMATVMAAVEAVQYMHIQTPDTPGDPRDLLHTEHYAVPVTRLPKNAGTKSGNVRGAASIRPPHTTMEKDSIPIDKTQRSSDAESNGSEHASLVPLQRQLKNRHIAMIRSVRSLLLHFPIAHSCVDAVLEVRVFSSAFPTFSNLHRTRCYWHRFVLGHGWCAEKWRACWPSVGLRHYGSCLL
jgi:hypothetical protein